MLCRRPCSAPSRSAALRPQYALHRRKLVVAFAQQLATVHPTSSSVREDDGKGSKLTVPVQVTRPPLPCEKPLPLANVMEVQRLLFLLEAPEYCMRAFREHGVNGQDLLNLQEDDLDDSRFKFPRPIQRKVLRIAEAWRSFHVLCGGPTHRFLSLDRFLEHHVQCGRCPEALAQLQSAFRALDVNNNGSIGFEEFLVGYSLLESAAAQPMLAAAATEAPSNPANGPSDPRVISSADGSVPPAAAATAAATTPLVSHSLSSSSSGGAGGGGRGTDGTAVASTTTRAVVAAAAPDAAAAASAPQSAPPVVVAATAATAAATAATAAAAAAAAACAVAGGSLLRVFAGWLRS